MPQTPSRKKAYAKLRREKLGDVLRAKQREWAVRNREHVRQKSADRRVQKRAMCLAAAARVRARKKGVGFSLDANDIAALQAVIDAGVCQVSGARFVLQGPRSAFSPSLDRVDPRKGYVRGNVRVVCHAVNAALGDWGEATLRAILKNWLRA